MTHSFQFTSKRRKKTEIQSMKERERETGKGDRHIKPSPAFSVQRGRGVLQPCAFASMATSVTLVGPAE